MDENNKFEFFTLNFSCVFCYSNYAVGSGTYRRGWLNVEVVAVVTLL
jgi:hypothetical protein